MVSSRIGIARAGASTGMRVAFVFGVVVAGLAAQGSFVWALRPAVVRPSADGNSMVYDAARARSVLFSRTGAATWEWDGTDWTQRFPAHSPSQYAFTLAYDSIHSRVLLCGGPLGRLETWAWNGTDWTDLTPATLPPYRVWPTIAFDSARARLVMFGGGFDGAGASFDDTWEWDGALWLQRTPAVTPPMRARHEMAFDPVRGRTVMFGGTSASWYVYGDTWEWDGINWIQRFPVHSPRNRFEHSMTFDSLRNRVVLFAGGGNGSDDNDTWDWDGIDWTLRNTANRPLPRAYQSLTYDMARDRLVMFGGGGFIPPQNETWELAPQTLNPAQYTLFGQGCAGHFGVPALGVSSGMPILGTTMQLACTSLPPDHFTTMWLGFSNTSWIGGSLPFDLGTLGMTYCTLFVSNDYVAPQLNWGGTACFNLAIPNAPMLLGVRFYNQVGTIDRVNPLGMIVSNAGMGVIGDG